MGSAWHVCSRTHNKQGRDFRPTRHAAICKAWEHGGDEEGGSPEETGCHEEDYFWRSDRSGWRERPLNFSSVPRLQAWIFNRSIE